MNLPIPKRTRPSDDSQLRCHKCENEFSFLTPASHTKRHEPWEAYVLYRCERGHLYSRCELGCGRLLSWEDNESAGSKILNCQECNAKRKQKIKFIQCPKCRSCFRLSKGQRHGGKGISLSHGAALQAKCRGPFSTDTESIKNRCNSQLTDWSNLLHSIQKASDSQVCNLSPSPPLSLSCSLPS